MFVEKPKEEIYDVIINKVSLLGCFCFKVTFLSFLNSQNCVNKIQHG